MKNNFKTIKQRPQYLHNFTEDLKKDVELKLRFKECPPFIQVQELNGFKFIEIFDNSEGRGAKPVISLGTRKLKFLINCLPYIEKFLKLVKEEQEKQKDLE